MGKHPSCSFRLLSFRPLWPQRFRPSHETRPKEVETCMSAAPNYIHPKEIEKARNELWRQHQGTNAISAYLFNFIIYAKKNSRKEYLEKIAQNVIKKFPCRIILITES